MLKVDEIHYLVFENDHQFVMRVFGLGMLIVHSYKCHHVLLSEILNLVKNLESRLVCQVRRRVESNKK